MAKGPVLELMRVGTFSGSAHSAGRPSRVVGGSVRAVKGKEQRAKQKVATNRSKSKGASIMILSLGIILELLEFLGA